MLGWFVEPLPPQTRCYGETFLQHDLIALLLTLYTSFFTAPGAGSGWTYAKTLTV